MKKAEAVFNSSGCELKIITFNIISKKGESYIITSKLDYSALFKIFYESKIMIHAAIRKLYVSKYKILLISGEQEVRKILRNGIVQRNPVGFSTSICCHSPLKGFFYSLFKVAEVNGLLKYIFNSKLIVIIDSLPVELAA